MRYVFFELHSQAITENSANIYIIQILSHIKVSVCDNVSQDFRSEIKKKPIITPI